jgi:nucleotide-binding universal stress UspA family protein
VASVFEQERQRALERAETALTIFKAEAKDAGISNNCRAIDAIPAEAISIAAGTARLHDLTIVSQPEGDGDTFDNELPQQILFEAGSPVLFIPYTFRGTFAAKRVAICWDGSRLASRALRDAMPFLRQADALTIITIGKSDTIPAEATPEHLLLYLARAGLFARIVSLPAGHSEIQPAILSVAADESLDFLVMGGYGQSRIQETVMGGVTRLPPKERHALRIGPIVLGNNRFHNSNIVLHATNSGGNISSQSFWLIFGSAAFVHDLVSNRCPALRANPQIDDQPLTNEFGPIRSNKPLTAFDAVDGSSTGT